MEIVYWFGLGTLLVVGLIWYLISRGNNKKDEVYPQDYLFKYYLGSNIGKPVEFLEYWKLTDLDNHDYILILTLDTKTNIEEYLFGIWKEYKGSKDITIEAYRREGIMDIKHTLVGKLFLVEGRMDWIQESL